MSDKTDKLIRQAIDDRVIAAATGQPGFSARSHIAEADLRAEIATIEAERDALRARVAELEAERRNLWRQTDANEGTLLTYCAVHAVRWQSSWGEPACGFIQAEA